MSAVPRVVHRDEHLLVLEKPALLPTTSPDESDCLFSRARALDPAAPRLHATSRLDSEVTGLVTFARTQRAIDATLEARRRGAYARLYLALSAAAPDPLEGEWTWPIARHPRDRRLRVAGEGRDPQAAATRYLVAARASSAVLLHLFPRTGRTHQLRAHAARAGSPLLGDTAYGGARRVVLGDGRVRTADRVMLHCARVELPHPGSGELVVFRCEVPADFAKLWQNLGGDSSALTVP